MESCNKKILTGYWLKALAKFSALCILTNSLVHFTFTYAVYPQLISLALEILAKKEHREQLGILPLSKPYDSVSLHIYH